MPNGVFYIKEEKKIKRQKKLQNLQLTQQGHEEAVRDAQLPAKQPPVRDGRRQRERIADDRDGKVRAHQVQQDDVHRGPKLRGGREGRKICWVLITFGIVYGRYRVQYGLHIRSYSHRYWREHDMCIINIHSVYLSCIPYGLLYYPILASYMRCDNTSDLHFGRLR